ncbi:rust resistance kinase Lr10-like [Prunus avium]|uniref:Rust resistance kinase Lr10-like n=1 Tax=Prunus avium TaxID=42229 RepID=A0A6P5RHH8_PRUAV|nr:rust resistance kinase Lr10-like [Prunus avium]
MAFSKVLGETQNTCKELKCGDKGPPIHFPFSLKDRQPDHCGYRGFAVSCNERHQSTVSMTLVWQRTVSMTTAMGTMGYIAPEVFSRNFGNVSYKSDVYSFGMLLLEMKREMTYESIWVKKKDGKIPNKLAIVGLWCIQWYPVNRPSMKAVIQMLEKGENLTMPPNPFASTGAAQTNASRPARNLKIQLEAIPELE